MISYPLLWQSVCRNYKILSVLALLLTVYIVLIVGMYDPQVTEKVEGLLLLVPEELLYAFGFQKEYSGLTGFLSSYLFGFLLLLFPMFYTIFVSDRLVASSIEKGSMVYYIATPNARWKIAVTQACFLSGSLAVLFIYVGGIGTAACEWMFPGELSVSLFWKLCLGAYALHFAISGFLFLSACSASDRKHFYLYGAGIPVLCYLFHMLSLMSSEFEMLQYVTVFTLFDTKKILYADPAEYIYMAVLAAAGIVFYGIGIIIFRKRDLSI